MCCAICVGSDRQEWLGIVVGGILQVLFKPADAVGTVAVLLGVAMLETSNQTCCVSTQSPC